MSSNMQATFSSHL